MIKIDDNLLAQECYYAYCGLHSNFRKSILRRDFSSFHTLNDALQREYGYHVKTHKGFYTAELYDYLYKKEDKQFRDFLTFYAENANTLKRIGMHVPRYLKKIKFPYIPFSVQGRKYSEKDFVDLIYEFYNTFGEKYYKVAKSFFDEKRIQLGSKSVTSDAGGYYSDIEFLESGFVFIKNDALTSKTASYLVHELGHAMDGALFIYPQQKDIPVFSDCYAEIPSTTFEIAFNNYLKEKKIDYYGGYLLNNERINIMKNDLKELRHALNRENLYILDSGYALDMGSGKKTNNLSQVEQFVDDVFGTDEDYIDYEDFSKIKNEVKPIVEDAETPNSEEEETSAETDNVESNEGSEVEVSLKEYRAYDLRDDTLYGLGYMFGLTLDLYRTNNMKDYLKILHNIMSLRKESTVDDLIKMTGINYEDFVTARLIKPTLEDNAKVLKKKYNL